MRVANLCRIRLGGYSLATGKISVNAGCLLSYDEHACN